MVDHTPTADMSAADPADEPQEQAVAEAFVAYRDEIRGAFPVPAPVALFDAARRRNRQRRVATGLTAAMLAGVVAGGAALAHTINRPERTPALPPPEVKVSSAAPSPSPTPQPRDSDSSEEPPEVPDKVRIDLRNATIQLPEWPDGACAAGTYRFVHGEAATSTGRLRILPGGASPRYANVDDRSGTEALARIQCGTDDKWADGVVALRLTAGNTATALAYVVTFEPGVRITGVSANDGVVTVTTVDTRAPSGGERHRFRWDGERFAEAGDPTESPNPGDSPSADPGPTTPTPVSPTQTPSP